jgi:hypothetical protein
MMAITTKSSIRVKPDRERILMIVFLARWKKEHDKERKGPRRAVDSCQRVQASPDGRDPQAS